ncbi:MAG TPA: aminotransferase class V-fold PLP-dependent enzyme [Patescibacteria group bacterium]|nr:aminotransferase class V-fold PLP-dependent enzyme [Patescibacteria group bacterium]
MIYFDNAATTYPKPETVYQAVNKCMREYCANPGRSGHKLSMEAGRVVLEARELLAELFGTKKSDNIIFGLNATDALNTAIKGLANKGDHIITTSMEHNSVLRPLKQLEKQGVETTIVRCNETGELNLTELEANIKSNTKIIITTHASNVTGTLMPIKEIGEIAKRNKLIYIIDTAQTAGTYKLDVSNMNVDVLTFTGHKGLMGPQGVGGFYIREGIALRQMREGGTGSMSDSLIQPEILPDKFESGTPNTPGIAGLSAGLKFIKEVGIDHIRKHEEELTSYFIKKLSENDEIIVYGPQNILKQAPVVALNIKNKTSSEVSFILDNQFDIATRPGLHCAPLAHQTIGTKEQGAVRFSFGYFNTIEEIDKAISALKYIAKEECF